MRRSKIEQKALSSALEILANPKCKMALKARITELLFRYESERTVRTEAKRQRQHEREMAKLRTERTGTLEPTTEPESDGEQVQEQQKQDAVASARAFLESVRRKGSNEQKAS